MNRRDAIILIIILLWGLFIIFGLEHVTKTAHEMIVCFNGSIIIMIIFLLILTIGPVSKWGNKKIFDHKKQEDYNGKDVTTKRNLDSNPDE